MNEDIGKLIGEGFATWRNNLDLCIPFVLSFVFSILTIIPLIIAAVAALGPLEMIESLSSEEILTKMGGAWPSIIAAFILVLLLSILISSFFEAGAIGMARQALETGRAQTGTMWSSGRKYFLRMLVMSILTGLITVAGLVLLLPGILSMPQPLTFQDVTPEPQAIGLMALGLILLIIYVLIISIILATAPYALVIDGLGAVDAIKAAIRFFGYNKFDVFVLWVIVLAISFGLQMIGSSVSMGHDAAALPLSVITGLVSLLVLSPLSTVWWTRLYMSRTGRLEDNKTEAW